MDYETREKYLKALSRYITIRRDNESLTINTTIDVVRLFVLELKQNINKKNIDEDIKKEIIEEIEKLAIVYGVKNEVGKNEEWRIKEAFKSICTQ